MLDVLQIAQKSHEASLRLASFTSSQKNQILSAIVKKLEDNRSLILTQNVLDLANVSDEDAILYDRLKLTEERITGMINGVKQIIDLPDPIGKVTSEWIRPNGLIIKKVRAPLGVIAIIYEARPNVTVDATALCIKSGNAVVLRGSKSALKTNIVLLQLMKEAVIAEGFDEDIIQMITLPDYSYVIELLKQDKYIDVVIPRGGEQLKRFILDNSKIPVIASAGGNCHIYVEQSADVETAVNVAVSAKISRPSVCNAAEHILVDQNIAQRFLPLCVDRLLSEGVIVKGDKLSQKICPQILSVGDKDFSTEYLDKVVSIKIVEDYNQAIEHINQYGTRHSEAILSTNEIAVSEFEKRVDAAAIYVNASTRFTDGFEFGFGAEMGISTNKLHARGPLGLEQLTSEKYIILGNGQTR